MPYWGMIQRPYSIMIEQCYAIHISLRASPRSPPSTAWSDLLLVSRGEYLRALSGNVRHDSIPLSARALASSMISAPSISYPYSPRTHAHPARAAGSFFASVFPVALDTAHAGTE